MQRSDDGFSSGKALIAFWRVVLDSTLPPCDAISPENTEQLPHGMHDSLLVEERRAFLIKIPPNNNLSEHTVFKN